MEPSNELISNLKERILSSAGKAVEAREEEFDSEARFFATVFDVLYVANGGKLDNALFYAQIPPIGEEIPYGCAINCWTSKEDEEVTGVFTLTTGQHENKLGGVYLVDSTFLDTGHMIDRIRWSSGEVPRQQMITVIGVMAAQMLKNLEHRQSK